MEPRGFEPLTSAVQRRYGLSGCVLVCPRVWLMYGDFGRSEAYAFRLCSAPSYWGCCTVAAQGELWTTAGHGSNYIESVLSDSRFVTNSKKPMWWSEVVRLHIPRMDEDSAAREDWRVLAKCGWAMFGVQLWALSLKQLVQLGQPDFPPEASFEEVWPYGYGLLRTIAANSGRSYGFLRNHYPSNSGKRLSKNRRFTRARRPRTPTLSNAFERCSWTVCLEI